MKLQKRLSRIYKTKKYYKYEIVLPEPDIKKAGFNVGDELITDIKKGEIKIKKR